LQGLAELKQFCAGITQYVGGHVECSPVPGITTNYGLEFKVILTFIPSAYSKTLLRAYLRADAPPFIDVGDQQGPQPCNGLQDFAQRLTNYLRVQTVLETLDTYRKWAEAHRQQAP
jgi:hypothetical protein